MKHTLKSFQENMRISWHGYGTYEVKMYFKRYYRRGISHNAQAYDRIKYGSDLPSKQHADGGYTEKQAYERFFDCLTAKKVYYV